MGDLRPYPLYLSINVAFGLAFMRYATISSVYRIQTVGLNPLQLVLVGTVLELAVLVFEVPTGVLADTYGRRRSVIFGFLLIGAGFSYEGTLPTFATVLSAQVIWGAGLTFISGALQAWIADESRGQDLGRIYLRGEQADYVGSFFGVFASALLATVALNLPLLLAGALAGVLGVTLTFLMQERNVRPTPRGTRRLAPGGRHGERWRPARARPSGAPALRPERAHLRGGSRLRAGR